MREVAEGLWRCQNNRCGAVGTATDVRRVVLEDGEWLVCPHCGGPVATTLGPTRILAEATKPVPSFASALLYPFRGRGLFALLVGTFVVGLLRFGMPFLYALVIDLLVYGYICTYLLEVVFTTANGDDLPPEFPDFTSWWEDVLQPLLLVSSTTLLCFAPALLYFVLYLARCWYEGWVPEPDEPMCAVGVISGAFLSLAYYPMALLAVVMHNLRRAADPRFVVPAIVRVWRPYLAVVGFMVLTGAVQLGFHYLATKDYLAFHFGGVFLELWGLMVSLRLLGLLYRANKERLGWF